MPGSEDADERWRAVFSELLRRANEDAEFRTRVESTGAVISNCDALLTRHHPLHTAASSSIACREYWWGFQLEIPHPRLVEWIERAAESAHIAAAIHPGHGATAAFHRRLSLWLARHLADLQQVDRGEGTFVSMMWMAPNIFLATPID